jgi:hypothetical protein
MTQKQEKQNEFSFTEYLQTFVISDSDRTKLKEKIIELGLERIRVGERDRSLLEFEEPQAKTLSILRHHAS